MKLHEVGFMISRLNGLPIRKLNEVISYLETNSIFLSEQSKNDGTVASRIYRSYGDAVVYLKIYCNSFNRNYDVHARFFDTDKRARKGLEVIARDLGFLMGAVWDEAVIELDRRVGITSTLNLD